MAMTLQKLLTEMDARYSPEHRMVRSVAKTPGYHTRIADGATVHQTRETSDYALALLASGEPARIARAQEVIDKILCLQNVDPTHTHYGIWSWFLEEPVEQMAPADWNWADFIGARLAQVLVQHEAKLAGNLATRVRESLGHAAWSIFRRNVQSGYTNIAIMGAGVTLAAGEVLSDRRLLEYGRKRLHDMVESVAVNGDFREYNSPTYTRVALEELERLLMLVSDPTARADAESLRRVAWRVIAEHFHPATQQWAGPHSRAYSDRIGMGLAQYLSAMTGVEIRPHAPGSAQPEMNLASSGEPFHLVTPLPCPPDLVERFRALPEIPHVIRRTFIPRKAPAVDTVGTTWFDDLACLASINRDSTWNQRRPLLGYWRTGQDPAVVFRLRVLKNGRDFAPAWLRQAQAGPRVLTAFHFVTGAGDFHPIFGGHPDNVYPDVSDLRIRYSLAGAGVRAEQLDAHRFRLTAGERTAVIHVTDGTFEGRALRWELATEPAEVRLEATLYAGPPRPLDLKTISLPAAAGVEIIKATDAPSGEELRLEVNGDEYAASWRGLEVQTPLRAIPFAW